MSIIRITEDSKYRITEDGKLRLFEESSYNTYEVIATEDNWDIATEDGSYITSEETNIYYNRLAQETGGFFLLEDESHILLENSELIGDKTDLLALINIQSELEQDSSDIFAQITITLPSANSDIFAQITILTNFDFSGQIRILQVGTSNLLSEIDVLYYANSGNKYLKARIVVAKVVSTSLPTLSWNNSIEYDEDIISYQLQIAPNYDWYGYNSFTYDDIAENLSGITFFTITNNLTEDVIYVWRVRSWDGYEWGDWSDENAVIYTHKLVWDIGCIVYIGPHSDILCSITVIPVYVNILGSILIEPPSYQIFSSQITVLKLGDSYYPISQIAVNVEYQLLYAKTNVVWYTDRVFNSSITVDVDYQLLRSSILVIVAYDGGYFNSQIIVDVNYQVLTSKINVLKIGDSYYLQARISVDVNYQVLTSKINVLKIGDLYYPLAQIDVDVNYQILTSKINVTLPSDSYYPLAQISVDVDYQVLISQITVLRLGDSYLPDAQIDIDVNYQLVYAIIDIDVNYQLLHAQINILLPSDSYYPLAQISVDVNYQLVYAQINVTLSGDSYYPLAQIDVDVNYQLLTSQINVLRIGDSYLPNAQIDVDVYDQLLFAKIIIGMKLDLLSQISVDVDYQVLTSKINVTLSGDSYYPQAIISVDVNYQVLTSKINVTLSGDSYYPLSRIDIDVNYQLVYAIIDIDVNYQLLYAQINVTLPSDSYYPLAQISVDVNYQILYAKLIIPFYCDFSAQINVMVYGDNDTPSGKIRIWVLGYDDDLIAKIILGQPASSIVFAKISILPYINLNAILVIPINYYLPTRITIITVSDLASVIDIISHLEIYAQIYVINYKNLYGKITIGNWQDLNTKINVLCLGDDYIFAEITLVGVLNAKIIVDVENQKLYGQIRIHKPYNSDIFASIRTIRTGDVYLSAKILVGYDDSIDLLSKINIFSFFELYSSILVKIKINVSLLANVNVEALKPIDVDITADVTEEVWTSQNEVTFEWTDATDPYYGFECYYYYQINRISNYEVTDTDILNGGSRSKKIVFEESGHWYFHVRAKNVNDAYSPNTAHFHLMYNNIPNPPSNLLVNNLTSPANIYNYNPEFSWASGFDVDFIDNLTYVIHIFNSSNELIKQIQWIIGNKYKLHGIVPSTYDDVSLLLRFDVNIFDFSKYNHQFYVSKFESENIVESSGEVKYDLWQYRYGSASIILEYGEKFLSSLYGDEFSIYHEFTIETDILFPTVGQATIFAAYRKREGGNELERYSDTYRFVFANNKLHFYYPARPTQNTPFDYIDEINCDWEPTSQTWYSIAISKKNYTFRFFVDGNLIYSTDVENLRITDFEKVFIGYATQNVKLDNLIFTKKCLYTSNYTPIGSPYSFNMSEVLVPGTYYWKVFTFDQNQLSEASDTATFTIYETINDLFSKVLVGYANDSYFECEVFVLQIGNNELKSRIIIDVKYQVLKSIIEVIQSIDIDEPLAIVYVDINYQLLMSRITILTEENLPALIHVDTANQRLSSKIIITRYYSIILDSKITVDVNYQILYCQITVTVLKDEDLFSSIYVDVLYQRFVAKINVNVDYQLLSAQTFIITYTYLHSIIKVLRPDNSFLLSKTRVWILDNFELSSKILVGIYSTKNFSAKINVYAYVEIYAKILIPRRVNIYASIMVVEISDIFAKIFVITYSDFNGSVFIQPYFNLSAKIYTGNWIDINSNIFVLSYANKDIISRITIDVSYQILSSKVRVLREESLYLQAKITTSGFLTSIIRVVYYLTDEIISKILVNRPDNIDIEAEIWIITYDNVYSRINVMRSSDNNLISKININAIKPLDVIITAWIGEA